MVKAISHFEKIWLERIKAKEKTVCNISINFASLINNITQRNTHNSCSFLKKKTIWKYVTKTRMPSALKISDELTDRQEKTKCTSPFHGGGNKNTLSGKYLESLPDCVAYFGFIDLYGTVFLGWKMCTFGLGTNDCLITLLVPKNTLSRK